MDSAAVRPAPGGKLTRARQCRAPASGPRLRPGGAGVKAEPPAGRPAGPCHPGRMTAADYRLDSVDDLDAGGVRQVRRIYEAGFAPHLRAGFDELLTGRQPGEVAFALTGDGQPRGFAMLRPLGGTGWIFLRYFVVDETRRGQGLGGILWDLLTARLAAAGFSLLVWDVEDPDEPGTDAGEVLTRSRRITFYLRHGGWLLPVQGYRTPHEDAGHVDWTPMR